MEKIIKTIDDLVYNSDTEPTRDELLELKNMLEKKSYSPYELAEIIPLLKTHSKEISELLGITEIEASFKIKNSTLNITEFRYVLHKLLASEPHE